MLNNGGMSIADKAGHEVAEVALLSGEGAGEMLSAAMNGLGVVRSWQVHSVHHRPGAGVTVGYSVQVDYRAGHGESPMQLPGSDEVVDEYICATTGRLSNPGPSDQLVRMEGPGGMIVHVWRHPADPELPALATACDPSAMTDLLGVPVGLELLSYRPTRRAVLRVNYPDGARAYAKVVRPAHLASLSKRHRMLTDAGVPAPRVLAEDQRGLVLISSGLGQPLANLLAAGMGSRTDAIFHELIRVLDQFPPQATSLTHRPSWSDRSDHYAHAATTVLPDLQPRIDILAAGIKELMAASDPGPIVPVHGDFYEANILMNADAGTVECIIDVDSLGPGHRVDDIACLLGHVSVLPHLAPRVYPHVPHELERWSQLAESAVDPVALFARCAGVTLSLVAGARREDGREWMSDAEGRLAAAEAWLARGRHHLARRSRMAAGN